MNPPFHKQFSIAGICLLGGALVLPALLFFPPLAQAAPVTTATPVTTAGKIIQVGGNSQVRTIAEAAAIAEDGDTVVIAPGEYYGDVATWRQDRLTIRAGAGGRVKLIAAGSHAGGKGIWVIGGGRVTVEDIDFVGARVPDHNGAGIRFEKGHLVVKRCSFKDSENGILTAGDPSATLEIENSEFGNNGDGSGSTHNLYVGDIGMLKVTGSYFHHARQGHLLKSRARENLIFYNRLTDEVGGQASYELEFPNGGMAYVIGNIIEQSATTDNSTVISFGAEGYRSALNALYLASNTIVDDRPQGGIMLRVADGERQVYAVNNLLVGQGKLDGGQVKGWRDRLRDLAKAAYYQDSKLLWTKTGIDGRFINNFNVDWSAFALPVRYDYRLLPESGLDGKFVLPEEVKGVSLVPKGEYIHPAKWRTLAAKPTLPGALQTGAPAGTDSK
ncbi:MAG: right-handed parallel beta-helix repeat-containing protein [Burkholderiaceae bacterium]